MGGAKDAVEYAAARTLVGAVRRLPDGLAESLGTALGSAAHRTGARIDVVRRQIAAAFPGRDPGWVDATIAGCYRHFGREAAVMARLPGTGANLLERVTVGDEAERWIRRMVAGEAVLVVTGHLGNWEVAGACLAARGVRLAAVVKRQRNARFDRWLVGLRRRLGVEPIYMQDAREAVPRLLEAGRSVALVADQDAGDRGIAASFLGRPASTFRGPARFALRSGAPLVFGAAVREDVGYGIHVRPVREGGSAGEVELTRRWVALLEAAVRERPQQYFWFHRRWKSLAGAARNEDGARAVRKAGSSAKQPEHGEAEV